MFTNEETASAPAQQVLVTDQLDPAKVDLSSLSLSAISFGDHVISPPPGLADYSTDVDLRPAKNLIVRVTAHLDAATGVLTWRFRSLDPATMQPPQDPLAGFLPPDTSPPGGEGSVLFTIMPKAGLATGTEIRNKATIVFDQNAPIDTQEWLNTLDNSKPSSHVLLLPTIESSRSFLVQWAGTDVGAGIQDYSVFVSEDGGPYTAWQIDTPVTSATFTGKPGSRYAFYSVARDRAGNVEAAHTTADAKTTVAAATRTVVASSANPSVTGQQVTYTATVSTAPPGGGTATGTVAFSDGGSGISGCNARALSGGQATCTVTYLAVGTHRITAAYTPDTAAFLPSTSATQLAQTVNRDATSTTLVPSSSSVLFGQKLTLTATVTANPPGSGVPTGTVTFADGGVALGSAPVNAAGRAVLSASVLLGGPHTALTAVYGGDGNYIGSTSAPANVTVRFTSCVNTVSPGKLTVLAGQAVCITGTVNGPVTVQAGGALAISGGSVTGPVTITGATAVAACAARTGPLRVEGASGGVLVGDAGDDGTGCAANTIAGPVILSGDVGGLELGGNAITGPVTVNGNGAGIPPEGSGAEIEANRISGPLSCTGNTPAPTNDGLPNIVGGPRTGQCAML